MKAEIITIGDEILIGQIVDTNSAWISEQLNLYGIEVYQITSVHDSREHILAAIDSARKNADLVLMTGGLGPTRDDITKHTLCEYFGTRLVLDEEVLSRVQDMLTRRGVQINQLNRDQALVPESCKVIPNGTGTAPGMWFEKDDTIFVSMPGVPFEMMYMMENEILPRLQRTGKTKSIYHKTVLTQGLPESMLAETIEQWENSLPSFIRLAYLPSNLMVKLRLSAYGTDVGFLKAEVEKQIEVLKTIIPDYIFGYNDETLAGVVGKMLTRLGCTLSTAESCTGGNIAHFITSNPGSSAYFKGSVVAYSNEIKKQLLNVEQQSLEKYGAVSEQVACEMAAGVKKQMGTDYAVSTTGIAGPDGGTEEKPVGTVWIAVAGKNGVMTKKFSFWHNRERNILRSTQSALNLLRRIIIEENPVEK
ncbi:MAG: competence/damage-inducible protein A [Prolixibacteraceae bacterium]|jgi:nicotinamide-nucleotide amidase|nr:competence/damage-inducible protein A [Prolixibacteraceae bacterium]